MDWREESANELVDLLAPAVVLEVAGAHVVPRRAADAEIYGALLAWRDRAIGSAATAVHNLAATYRRRLEDSGPLRPDRPAMAGIAEPLRLWAAAMLDDLESMFAADSVDRVIASYLDRIESDLNPLLHRPGVTHLPEPERTRARALMDAIQWGRGIDPRHVTSSLVELLSGTRWASLLPESSAVAGGV